MTTKNVNDPKEKKKEVNNENETEVVNTNEEEREEEENDDDGDWEILPSNDAGITMDDNAYTGEPHQREGD